MRCLLVIETAGHVAVVDHDTGVWFRFEQLPTAVSATAPAPVPDPPPPTRTAVWSPAGQWTAWVRPAAHDDDDAAAVVVLHDEDTEFNRVVADADADELTPSPCGRFLAHASPGPLGTELAVTDVRSGALRVVERADPLSWSWSPDGTWLAVRAGERVFAVRPDDGRVEALAEGVDPSGPPCWTADGSVVLAAAGTLRRHDPHGTVTDLVRRDPAAAVARFALDPDGRRLAWSGPPGRPDATVVTDLVSGDTAPVIDDPVLGCCWSPDGRRLALLQPAGAGHLRWIVSGGGWAEPLEAFRPTEAWREQVLPRFDQHLVGRSVWSPDGASLVVPAVGDDGGTTASVQVADRPADPPPARRPRAVRGVALAWWAD